MKSIESLGGPFVILADDARHLWGGNVRRCLSQNGFPDDYEAASALTCGVLNAPCNISKVAGVEAEALLISTPYEIALISSADRCVRIAQVEYAEPHWSFDHVSAEDFDTGHFVENVKFFSNGSRYYLFDSVCLFEEVGDEYLAFELPAGGYVLSAAYISDHIKGLTLYKIDPVAGAE